MAAARIWMNMIAETTESSNVAILEHKNNTCIYYIFTFVCHGEYHYRYNRVSSFYRPG
jgi:hypothetical protein